MTWFCHITSRSTPSSSINTVPLRPPWRQFSTVEMVWGTYFFVMGIWQNWDTICWLVHLPSDLSKHLLWIMFTHDVSMSISTVREGRGKHQKWPFATLKNNIGAIANFKFHWSRALQCYERYFRTSDSRYCSSFTCVMICHDKVMNRGCANSCQWNGTKGSRGEQRRI